MAWLDKATVSVLLAIAVGCFQWGIPKLMVLDYLGIIVTLVGLAIVYGTVLLWERGLIETVKKALGK